jgi:hypothetical protein
MESAFKQLPPETQFFIILILCFAIIFHVKFTDKAAHNGPTILTTTGIFATFSGITLALLHFDTANIQGSVPSLLEGLKTAFISSAFGIFCALTLKGREYVWGVPSVTEEFDQHSDATAADIVAQLRKVTNALVGSEEGSLITQIKLSRQDSNDRLDALRAAQIEALSKLSELGSKALVEALRDVIRDFNQKLTEQFGENFKELNAAVGRLLTWQEQYKEIVETTVQKFSKVEALMAKATDDYASLVKKSDSLVRAGENLNSTVTLLRAETERLQTVSAAVANLLRSAEGSLPQVEQKVLELTRQLSNAVSENQTQIGNALTENITATRNALQGVHENMAAAHREHGSQITELVQKTKEQMIGLTGQVTKAVTDNQKQIGDALTENLSATRTALQSAHEYMALAHQEHSSQIADLVNKTKDQITALTSQLTNAVVQNQKQIASALTENATATRNILQSANESMAASHKDHSSRITELVAKTKEQVTVLDKALSEELEKSLTSLGRQLTALSERFVADYSPLTEKLRRVVEMAR